MKSTSCKLKTFAAILMTILFASAAAQAQQIELTASAGSRLVVSGKKQTIPLKISLKGFAINSEQRAPVNISIVLDRSGSMDGDKMERAREAAIAAIERLRFDDVVSVISYDDVAEVIVPATKARDRDQIISAIRKVDARGSTALFAGVSRGASEVQKFLEKNRVNRVILISDGLANVGPSSPGELGALGSSLGKEGISVSTIGLGLGYNEDLMTQLAGRSDGNHAFVENSVDLAQVFQREFGDILSVVANDVDIRITCAGAFRPVRVIGRQAQINGQNVVIPLNQIYASQEKYAVLEVEVPEGKSGDTLELAKVEVSYSNLHSKQRDNLASNVAISYTESAQRAEASADKPTQEAYYTQLTIDSNLGAIALRDANKKEEAKQLLRNNAMMLKEKSVQYNLPELESSAKKFEKDAADMDSEGWNKQRKTLSDYNYGVQNQKSK